MSILGIDAVTYGVEDLATCHRFFLDWGLTLVAQDDDSLNFETLNGCQVRVVDSRRVSLPAAIEAGPTLREVVWGVEDEADLQRLQPVLARAPAFVQTQDELGCTDPNGLAIRFRVSRKHGVAVTGSPMNTWDHHARMNARGAIYDRAYPIEIGHVVFFVADVSAVQAFYAELGFVLSDSYPGKGAFMRCAPRRGHHNLFLLQVPDGKRGLNHVAFTVRDIHEVFGGGMHIDRCGWTTQLGPGRHPISSAYFWYFKSPAGGLCEYYADEDQLTEAWLPHEFEPGPTVFAEWAVAGGLDGTTRRQHNAQASGKFLTERQGD